jgi:transcriptional activator Myb
VKKKIDSYRASGLLAQIQPIAPVEYPAGTLNIDSSFAMTQQNSEDSDFDVVGEVEGSAELSQSSLANASCSQEEQIDASLGSHVHAHKSLCQEACYTNAEKVASTLPETHHQPSISDNDENTHLQQEFSQTIDLSFVIDEVPNSSMLTDSQASSEPAGQLQYTQTMCNSENHGASFNPYAVPLDVPVSMSHSVPEYEHNVDMMCEVGINSDKCLQSEQWQDMSFQPATCASEVVNNSSALLYPLQTLNSSTMIDIVQYQSSETLAPPDGVPKISYETSHFPVFHQDLEGNPCNIASVDPDQHSYISSEDDRNRASEPLEKLSEPQKKQLIDVQQSFVQPTSTFGKGTLSSPGDIVEGEKKDAEGLCYEPPCFPSFEVPFVRCDLITSSDLPEFSPLGIRELMRSSLNFPTPVRLWSSPPHDGSPDAVLKSAAKSFSSTPSIMKKRPRELLSPSSDIRVEKNLVTEQGSGSLGMSSKRIRRSCIGTTDESLDLFSPGEQTGLQQKKLKLFEENKENFKETTDQDEIEGSVIGNHLEGKRCSTVDSDFTCNLVCTFIPLVLQLYIQFLFQNDRIINLWVLHHL